MSGRKKKAKSDLFVPMTSWVTQDQKKKVQKKAKLLTKEKGEKITESSIIRDQIDKISL